MPTKAEPEMCAVAVSVAVPGLRRIIYDVMPLPMPLAVYIIYFIIPHISLIDYTYSIVMATWCQMYFHHSIIVSISIQFFF